MNKRTNKFLLSQDKFMPEMHVRQPALFGKPVFTYSGCSQFNKNKERKKI